MLTRSGKRAVQVEQRCRAGAGTRMPRPAPRRARRGTRSARPLRQRGVDHALLRVARRRVRRERDIGVGRRDHEVDLRERGGHRRVRLQAELLGDRGGAQVVERLRQVEAERDFVGEVATRTRGHRSPSSASSVERLPIIHCAARFGRSRWRSTSTSPVASMSSLAASRTRCLDRGRDVDHAAERREDRDAAAGEVVGAEPGFPSAGRRAGWTGPRGRNPRTRRRSAPRRAPSGRGPRARPCWAGRTPAASEGCGRRCPSSRAGRCSRRGCGSSRRRRRRSRG